MDFKLEGFKNNNEIDNGQLNEGYGVSPILSINKKLTEDEIKKIVSEDYKEITSIFINELLEEEKKANNFKDYLINVFELDPNDEEAEDEYSDIMYDRFYEGFSENPTVIIQTQNDNYTKFILY